jgi:hypothetical protein
LATSATCFRMAILPQTYFPACFLIKTGVWKSPSSQQSDLESVHSAPGPGTHPLTPSLTKRRGTQVPLFPREGFRVSSSGCFAHRSGTHPLTASLTKRRGAKVPLFLREGFRVSLIVCSSCRLETHPMTPSFTKRRGAKVPLFLREGFRVSSSSCSARGLELIP